MKIDCQTLQNLYPAPEDEFICRMGCFIREQPQKEERRMKRISKRLLIAAVLTMLALTTTAYAAARPAVLTWLLGFAPASEELIQTVQEIHAEQTADGVTIRITGLVWDGSQMAFTYEAEAADPTLAAIVKMDDVFTVDGREARISQPFSSEAVLVPDTRLDLAPVKRNPAVCGQWSKQIDGLSGKVQCEMTFRIYRPQKGLVFLIGAEDDLRNIDAQPDDYQADLRDRLACLQSLRNAIIPDETQQDAAYWIQQGYTVTDEHLMETAVLTLSFTFDADNVQTRDYSDAADVRLPDGTLHIERFVLSPLKTEVDVWLVPQENTREAAQMLADQHAEFALLDGQGSPLEYSSMDDMPSMTPYVTQLDGQWVARYQVERPGLAVFPETVAFSTRAGELLRLEP